MPTSRECLLSMPPSMKKIPTRYLKSFTTEFSTYKQTVVTNTFISKIS